MTEGHYPPSMDAGDVIRFDLREDAPRRIVANPRLVEEAGCIGLLDGLGASGKAPVTDSAHTADILEFPQRSQG